MVEGRATVGDCELPILGLFGECEVKRPVTRGDPEFRMRDDILDALSTIVHLTFVAQTIEVLSGLRSMWLVSI